MFGNTSNAEKDILMDAYYSKPVPILLYSAIAEGVVCTWFSIPSVTRRL